MRLRDLGERGFLSLLRSAFPGLALAGDDAAVLGPCRCPVLTTDTFLEGRHFHLWWCDPAVLGRRLLEASLSDLAAMGAEPAAALVSLAVPPDTEWEWLRAFYEGLLSRPDCPVAGGETVASELPCITVTALGEGGDPGTLLRRSALRAGDCIWLTGPVGRALDIARLMEEAGGLEGPGMDPRNPVSAEVLGQLRSFLSPRACFEEARLLRSRGVRCAIDVSDGVISEAGHLAAESGVSVRLDLERVPLLPPAQGRPGDACSAGEDFVLLFGAPTGMDFESCGYSRIGVALPGSGVRATFDGNEIAGGGGYDHFA